MSTVLMTGPLEGREAWSKAARGAGWEPVPWPLIEVEPLEVDLVARIDGLPDWLCITSRNALPAVARACKVLPELRSVPTAVVGPQTASAAAALGLDVGLECDEGARSLADALLAELGSEPAGKRILWPHGSLTDELALVLREAGLEVDDPVVYQTRPVDHAGPPPITDAVFFASPSAVKAWPADQRRPLAIAMGGSTRAALEELAEEPFTRIETLAAPKPQALAKVLEGLAERP